MKFSQFGEKFTEKSGILELMDDLGKAMASSSDDMIMMGGGNPAHIAEVNKLWKSRMQEIIDDDNNFHDMLVNYDTPQGNDVFIDALVSYFNSTTDWNISSKNIAVTNGSQNAFFYLFNILAGKHSDGSTKHIVFPFAPEYIGYADQGLCKKMFKSFKPIIKKYDNQTFKYFIDFDALKITEDSAAICVSRPTNPTGNVLTDEEIEKLDTLAKKHNIPLIIDNAYGSPFPNILFQDVKQTWNENIVLSMSLSKIGLPSTRTGFIIASEKIIECVQAANAVISLSTSKVGQIITAPLIKDQSLKKISDEIVRPYYQNKSNIAVAKTKELFKDYPNVHIHKSEGAMFLWLWFEDLPITTMELYNILKTENVIVVPGTYFFPGFDEEWKHKDECIRINYARDDIEKGLEILARVVKSSYNTNSK